MALMPRRQRRSFIEGYTFPAALSVKLRAELADDRQVAIALEGLREWYLACLAARGEMLGMPSRAVDVAWHEMILMTREYHAFCDKAFGRYLHHSPESLMDEPISHGLARTLAILESRSVGIAGVPLLFAVDGELGLEDGFLWRAADIARIRDSQDAAGVVRGGGLGSTAGTVWGGCSGGGSCGGGGCGGGGG